LFHRTQLASRVAETGCFRNTARELAECPDVATIQHDSGEYILPRMHPKCPIFFYRRYYAARSSQFRFLTLPAVSRSVPSWHAQNDDAMPLVVHNAFLRWSVLQDAALNDPGDNDKRKIWSETNVSEDFDMALFCLGWERHRPF
jgi:hypothetical protein